MIQKLRFTKSGKTSAEKYGIETLTPKEISKSEDLFERINPSTRFAFQISNCKFPDGIVFSFEKGDLPKEAKPDSSILIFPDRNTITIKEFEKELQKIVQLTWTRAKYDLEGEKHIEIEENLPPSWRVKQRLRIIGSFCLSYEIFSFYN